MSTALCPPVREQPEALARCHASWGRHYAEERKRRCSVVLNARFRATVIAGLDSCAAEPWGSDHLIGPPQKFSTFEPRNWCSASITRQKKILWLPQKFFYNEGAPAFALAQGKTEHQKKEYEPPANQSTKPRANRKPRATVGISLKIGRAHV